MKIIAFGNNVNGNIAPSAHGAIVSTPTDVSGYIKGEIIYTGWSCTIAIDGDDINVYGIDEIASQLHHLDLKGRKIKKVLATDSPQAFLLSDGSCTIYHGGKWIQSSLDWEDVTIFQTGQVFALNKTGIYTFPSLSDLIDNTTQPRPISHPLLTRHFSPTSQLINRTTKLHTTETKLLIHLTDKSVQNLIEHELTPLGEEVRVVEEFEGMEVEVIVGSRNRVGVVCGGDYYLAEKGGEFEVVHVGEGGEGSSESGNEEDEVGVKFVGLGSGHEVVVKENNEVWVRGSNQFGQLGLEGIDKSEDFIRHPYFVGMSIIGVRCSRWSTLVMVEES